MTDRELLIEIKLWAMGAVDCLFCGDVLFIHDETRRRGKVTVSTKEGWESERP
jgi:hypothetical protein